MNSPSIGSRSKAAPRLKIVLVPQMFLLAYSLMASALIGSAATADDPCDGKAPVIKHGYLEHAEQDEGIILKRDVVDLVDRLDDKAKRDAFYRRFAGIYLTQELERLLANIRSQWPDMVEVRVRGRWNPGTLVLQLEPFLLETVLRNLPEEGASAPLCTGHAAFDALNQTVNVRGVMTYPGINAILIAFDRRNDILFTALKYEAIEGVKSARPDAVLGDGSGIQAQWSNDKWYVVFRKAWGDCPAGCIHSELHYFIEHGVNVERLYHEDAEAIPEFAEVLAAHGWRQRGAGTGFDEGLVDPGC